MMASANVELVRSIFAAYGRGDLVPSVEWADPEIEFVMVGGPEPGIWNGLADVEAFAREWMDAWGEFGIEAEAFRELDDERVLVPARFGGHGRTSGLEVAHAKGCYLFYIRSGKVARQVFYFDRQRAFADLGLAPEAGSP